MPKFLFAVLCCLVIFHSPLRAQTHAELEQQMLELFKAGKIKEAIPVAILARSAAKEEFGDTAKRYTLGLTNLAFLYEQLKDYPPTEPIYTELVAIRKKTVGIHHSDYALALNDLANAYYASHKYAEAAPLYKEAAEIQKTIYGNTHPEYGVIAKNAANAYYHIKDLKESARYFEDCLVIEKKTRGEKSAQYIEVVESLALLYDYLGNIRESIKFHTISAAARKESKGENSTDYALIINILGKLYLDMADYKNAEAFMLKAKDIYQKTVGVNDTSYAGVINNLGALYRTTGDFKNAHTYYAQALALRKKLLGEAHPDYGQTLNNLAELYSSEGNYVVAEALYKEAIAIRRKVSGEDNEFYALNLNNLAALYTDMGKNTEAASLHLQILAIRKKTIGENHIDYAQTLNNLAIVYDNMGRYAESEQYYRQALAIRKKILGDDHPLYAQTLSNLGALYDNMGLYAEAESFFKQAIAIHKKKEGEEHPLYALALDNLANLYCTMGRYKSADSIYQQVLAIRKKVLGELHPDYARSLNNLASVYLSVNDFNKTEQLYQQVLNIYRKTGKEEFLGYAQALHNTGELYRRAGRLKEAETLLLQSLAIKRKLLGDKHPDDANTLLSLSVLNEMMGNSKKSAELLDSASTIMFYHVQNNFTNLNEEQKMQWWEDEASRYEMAPSLLVAHPDLPASFVKQTFMRQMQLKGFVLNDGKKMLVQVRKNGDAQLKSLLNEWETNKITLAGQYSLPLQERIIGLDSLEKATQLLEKQLNQQSSLFKAGQQSTQINFDDIKRKLKPDEAAIEFVRFNYFNRGQTDSVLYAAFIVKPDLTVPKFIVLSEEKKLARLLDAGESSSQAYVSELYRGLGAQNTVANFKADSLFSLVWKPLQSSLQNVKKIYLAPAGLLNRVSFNALASDSGRYLIDVFQIRQYSSVAEIGEKKAVAVTDPSDEIALFGGIDFEKSSNNTTTGGTVVLPQKIASSLGGTSWPALPGTLTEINTINKLYQDNKKKTKLLAGSAASEESFKALGGQSPRILHIATHGFSLPDATKNKDYAFYNTFHNTFALSENPLMRSGIIMAGANLVWKGGLPRAGQEDGIVTAYEISNLDLNNTDLVVLSACETALGDIRGTEGVFGLQRAFRLAGAKQMIVSLWQVPDKETVELMGLFYGQIVKGSSTADAFFHAQQEMRKKYPVYYWAAFLLIE